MKSALSVIVAELLLLGMSVQTDAASVDPVPVYVQCSGDDIVGTRLCFAVKEAIRRSTTFIFTPENAALFELRISSTDLEMNGKGKMSALSVYYGMKWRNYFPLYQTNAVYAVGAERVNDIAERIVAEIDKLLGGADNAALLKKAMDLTFTPHCQ